MKKRKFDSAVLSIPKCRKEITLDDLIADQEVMEFVRLMNDLMEYLKEYNEPDNNGRCVGVKYRDVCTHIHVRKQMLCELLEFMHECIGGYVYIPVNEEEFDLIVPLDLYFVSTMDIW